MLEVADKVIAGIKTVREIARKIENAELLNQVADLMGDSADLKMEIAELKSEIIGLRNENTDLKRKKDIRAKVEIRNGACYLTEPVPGYNEGPFCPICLETEGILVNVGRRTGGQFYCVNCKRYLPRAK